MRQELIQKAFDINMMLNNQMEVNDIDECLIDELQDVSMELSEDEYIATKAIIESLNDGMNIPGLMIWNN